MAIAAVHSNCRDLGFVELDGKRLEMWEDLLQELGNGQHTQNFFFFLRYFIQFLQSR